MFADRGSGRRSPVVGGWSGLPAAVLVGLVIAVAATVGPASAIEPFPTTVSGFFPATSPLIVVEVSSDPRPDLLAAGHAAVAALSSRYPRATVELAPAAPPGRKVGERIVRIEHSADTLLALQPETTVPTLEVGGHGTSLDEVAATLGSRLWRNANAALIPLPTPLPRAVSALAAARNVPPGATQRHRDGHPWLWSGLGALLVIAAMGGTLLRRRGRSSPPAREAPGPLTRE